MISRMRFKLTIGLPLLLCLLSCARGEGTNSGESNQLGSEAARNIEIRIVDDKTDNDAPISITCHAPERWRGDPMDIPVEVRYENISDRPVRLVRDSLHTYFALKPADPDAEITGVDDLPPHPTPLDDPLQYYLVLGPGQHIAIRHDLYGCAIDIEPGTELRATYTCLGRGDSEKYYEDQFIGEINGPLIQFIESDE